MPLSPEHTLVDLHAHTAHSRFNEGVPYSPEELLVQAKSRELGGIALTGHDTFEGLENAVEHAERLGIILVPGIEIMARKGLHFPHIVGLLPTDAALELARSGANAPRFRSPEYTADWIHAHGGVVIAPHPKPNGNIISLSYKQVAKLGSRLDAIETHTTHGVDDAMVHLAREGKLASVGSSDAHRLEEVGLVKTKVFGDCKSADDIIRAIKDGRVEGFIENPIPPELQGERSFKSLVKAYRTKKRI
jgi:predicted metal-dependent phosphoesterase TrpH